MGGVDPRWCPRVDSEVAWVDVDGEIVAIDGHDGVHLISATGALLWPLFDGTASLRDLADDVSAVFGVSAEESLRDIATFALSAADTGLVEDVSRI